MIRAADVEAFRYALGAGGSRPGRGRRRPGAVRDRLLACLLAGGRAQRLVGASTGP